MKDHVGYYTCDNNGNRTWYPDYGEKPIEGCQFVLIDQTYSFYVAYGKKGGVGNYIELIIQNNTKQWNNKDLKRQYGILEKMEDSRRSPLEDKD